MKWERESKDRSAAGAVLEPELAAMGFHDSFGQRKPDTVIHALLNAEFAKDSK